MSTLTEMIQAAIASGSTYQEITDRAVDPETGTHASKAWLHRLSAGKVDRMPELPYLRAIAVSLGKPLRLIQEAAIEQWLDYRADTFAGDDPDVRVIVAHLGQMSDGDRRRIRRFIESWSADGEGDSGR